jgi:hypothetical protein
LPHSALIEEGRCGRDVITARQTTSDRKAEPLADTVTIPLLGLRQHTGWRPDNTHSLAGPAVGRYRRGRVDEYRERLR